MLRFWILQSNEKIFNLFFVRCVHASYRSTVRAVVLKHHTLCHAKLQTNWIEFEFIAFQVSRRLNALPQRNFISITCSSNVYHQQIVPFVLPLHTSIQTPARCCHLFACKHHRSFNKIKISLLQSLSDVFLSTCLQAVKEVCLFLSQFCPLSLSSFLEPIFTILGLSTKCKSSHIVPVFIWCNRIFPLLLLWSLCVDMMMHPFTYSAIESKVTTISITHFPSNAFHER